MIRQLLLPKGAPRVIPIDVTSRRLDTPAELAYFTSRFINTRDGDVFCYSNGTAVDNPLLNALRRSGAALGRNGGEVRCVLPRAALGVPGHTPEIVLPLCPRTEVRYSSWLPPGAMMVTSRGAALTTDRAAGWPYLMVQESNTLRALRGFVQPLWQHAVAPVRPREEPPNAAERKLLVLLLAGMPDQTIACRLGLSDQAVRQAVTQLMERLGARSRFEAGMRAVERGWA